MASRIYLPSTGATTKTPAYNAGWENTSIAARLKTVLTKIASAMTTVSFDDSDTTDKDILFRQYVLEDSPLAAQTIAAQAIKFQMRCNQTDVNNNMFLTLAIHVFNSACDTLRGTILSVTRDDFETVVALTNRQFTATSTQVISETGDILVIEVGMGGDPTASGSHDSSISIGDDSGTDLPEDNSETAAYNPWIEFANTLSFYTVYSLTPEKTKHLHKVREPLLAAKQILSLHMIKHLHKVGEPVISSYYSITPDSIKHLHKTEDPIIIQWFYLIPDSIKHLHKTKIPVIFFTPEANSYLNTYNTAFLVDMMFDSATFNVSDRNIYVST